MMLRWAVNNNKRGKLGAKRRKFTQFRGDLAGYGHSWAVPGYGPYWGTEFVPASNQEMHRTYMKPFSERLREVVEAMARMP